MHRIPFNLPYTRPESTENVHRLTMDPQLLSECSYMAACKAWLEEAYPGYKAYLTTSCTRALELIALSMELQPGDEIIMPSFTYVGVANAFANYGAKLVFVDIEPETMNVDAALIEQAISDRTRAVVVMHYSGQPCNVQKIRQICDQNELCFIEDNAHGIGASHQGKPLGSSGDFSCISFDRQKNISTWEGGVLLCRERLSSSVDMAFDNGTNRAAFYEGKVNHYEWTAHGSNFGMSEYIAGILLPLLEQCSTITAHRIGRWNRIYRSMEENAQLAEFLPAHMSGGEHNGHIFYIKLKDAQERKAVSAYLNAQGISCSFHYIPLHLSKAGERFGRFAGEDAHTSAESRKILRLPIYHELSDVQIERMIGVLSDAVDSHRSSL